MTILWRTSLIKAGFRRGDDAPMAIIELVDRDVEAKKIDIKKKKQEPTKNKEDIKPEISSKKTKPKK